MFGWRHPARDSGGCRCGNARVAAIADSFRGLRADCVEFGAQHPRRLYMNGETRTCFFVLASLALMGTAEAKYEDRWVEGGCLVVGTGSLAESWQDTAPSCGILPVGNGTERTPSGR